MIFGKVDFGAGARVVADIASETRHPFSIQVLGDDLARAELQNGSTISPGTADLLVDTAIFTRPLHAWDVRIEPEVKKIAVLRSGGIGDFFFILPALQSLRETYPQAEVVLLGVPWHQEFLAGRPGTVDRVEIIPPSQGVRDEPGEDPVELERFFERMQAEKFDIALQMHGGGRYSNPFLKRLGARLTVGSRAADAEPLDRWVAYALYQPEVLRYLELASLAGARPSQLEPLLVVTEQDREEAAPYLPMHNQPLVVLHPGASDPRRRWPAEKFAAVGNAMARSGARLVVTGNIPEAYLGEAINCHLAIPAENLCGRLSLGGLAGLFSQAALVISNDTGPLHLARAVGVPTVGIYWCGNMITAGPVTRLWNRTAISWRLNCPVCGQDCTHQQCEHQESFVADIPVEEVMGLAQELFHLTVESA